MKQSFLHTAFRCMKQLFLSTFYGFRQCGLQVLCLLIMQWLIHVIGVNLPGIYRWILEGALCGGLLFTMLYHWMAMFISKEKPVARFVVPYVLCAAILYCWWVFFEQKELLVCLLSGVVAPFICQLFFLFEDYLKKVLTPHHKSFKGIKIVCNTFTLLPFLLVAVIAVVAVSDEISRRYRFDDAKTLTRITEVEFPKFKVVEYDRGCKSFHGDYSDELVLEFKEMPSEEFYAALENSSEWSSSDEGSYFYSRMWGNGMPAPKGEDDDEDVHLSIKIQRGEKRFHVTFGTW